MFEQFDKGILFFFNQSIKNGLFDFFFPLITKLGSYKIVFLLGIVIFLTGWFVKNHKMKFVGFAIFLSTGISTILVFLLKHFIDRPRPYMTYQEVIAMGQKVTSSFPSSHAAVAMALAFILSHFYKKFSFLFYALAILIGISRMYMGLHYPTDVLAGFGFGYAFGVLTVRLERKF